MTFMNDEITIDAIEKILWEITKHDIDQTQVDAFKVLIEARVAQQSPLWKKAPNEIIEAHLATLVTLARQLLDTGGRMILDRAGMLDVQDNPVATKADMEALGRHVVALDGTVREMLAVPATTAAVEATEVLATGLADEVAQLRADFAAATAVFTDERPPADKMPQWEIDLLNGKASTVIDPELLLTVDEAETFFEEDEPVEKVVEAFERGEKFVTKKPGKKTAPTRVLDDATRELVTQALGRKRKGTTLNDDGTLTCLSCGVAKPTDSYFRNSKSRLGLETKCKECSRRVKAA